MPDPARLRDSTQIVLRRDHLEGLEATLHERVTVTVVEEGEDTCRIVGSPVEIKGANEFLARNGVPVP